MIAEHLLTEDEASERLRGAGYEPASLSFEGHSAWKAPCGLHLLVPHLPPDRMVCERTLMERMAEMDAHARRLAN